MVYAYGDDGADEKRERVLAVSVIAGSEDAWLELELRWKERCGDIPFHAKDCESDWEDFAPSAPELADAKHKENKALYRDLTTMMVESKVGGIVVAIDLTARRKIFPDSPDISYYRALLECLARLTNLGENLGDVVKVTYDISTENKHNAELMYRTLRDAEPRLSKWLHPEISFVNWKDSSRVQTADLLAYEGWKALDHTIGPIKRIRQSWLALRASDRFETMSYSEDWFRDLKAHIDSGELGKIVGFSYSDYHQWLKEKKRHHDITNLILFTDCMRRQDEGKTTT
jgi:hypothetical protein